MLVLHSVFVHSKIKEEKLPLNSLTADVIRCVEVYSFLSNPAQYDFRCPHQTTDKALAKSAQKNLFHFHFSCSC